MAKLLAALKTCFGRTYPLSHGLSQQAAGGVLEGEVNGFLPGLKQTTTEQSRADAADGATATLSNQLYEGASPHLWQLLQQEAACRPERHSCLSFEHLQTCNGGVLDGAELLRHVDSLTDPCMVIVFQPAQRRQLRSLRSEAELNVEIDLKALYGSLPSTRPGGGSSSATADQWGRGTNAEALARQLRATYGTFELLRMAAFHASPSLQSMLQLHSPTAYEPLLAELLTDDLRFKAALHDMVLCMLEGADVEPTSVLVRHPLTLPAARISGRPVPPQVVVPLAVHPVAMRRPASGLPSSSAGSSQLGSEVVAGVVLRYSLGDGLSSLLQQLHCSHALLASLPGPVTLLTFNGRVLHQNTTSIAYMGLRQGLLPATAPDPGPGRRSTRSSGDTLRQLFVLEPGKLDDMLGDVAEGKVWKGIVRVPPLLTASLDTSAVDNWMGEMLQGAGMSKSQVPAEKRRVGRQFTDEDWTKEATVLCGGALDKSAPAPRVPSTTLSTTAAATLRAAAVSGLAKRPASSSRLALGGRAGGSSGGPSPGTGWPSADAALPAVQQPAGPCSADASMRSAKLTQSAAPGDEGGISGNAMEHMESHTSLFGCLSNCSSGGGSTHAQREPASPRGTASQAAAEASSSRSGRQATPKGSCALVQRLSFRGGRLQRTYSQPLILAGRATYQAGPAGAFSSAATTMLAATTSGLAAAAPVTDSAVAAAGAAAEAAAAEAAAADGGGHGKATNPPLSTTALLREYSYSPLGPGQVPSPGRSRSAKDGPQRPSSLDRHGSNVMTDPTPAAYVAPLSVGGANPLTASTRGWTDEEGSIGSASVSASAGGGLSAAVKHSIARRRSALKIASSSHDEASANPLSTSTWGIGLDVGGSALRIRRGCSSALDGSQGEQPRSLRDLHHTHEVRYIGPPKAKLPHRASSVLLTPHGGSAASTSPRPALAVPRPSSTTRLTLQTLALPPYMDEREPSSSQLASRMVSFVVATASRAQEHPPAGFSADDGGDGSAGKDSSALRLSQAQLLLNRPQPLAQHLAPIPSSSGAEEQQRQQRQQVTGSEALPSFAELLEPMPEAAAVAAVAALSSRPTEEGAEACWHEVTAKCVSWPATGEQVLLLLQADVTARVVAEQGIVAVLEAEHKLLESCFPRHVLELAAKQHQSPSFAAGSSRPDAGLSRFSLARLPVANDSTSTATHHPMVTVLFADIVGFTSMCHEVPAAHVMHFLNQLYTRLDSLLDVYGVYKVETIGDCYMVCGGLTRRDADGFVAVRRGGEVDELHAEKVMAFAKSMLRESVQVLLPTTSEPVQVRIGLHSGPVVSGIVGSKMPRFCLFGDTVNTASRMESTCPPGRIHASASTRALLPGEEWQATGGVQVKGKGRMETFQWAGSVVEHDRDNSKRLSTLRLVPLDGKGCSVVDERTARARTRRASAITVRSTGSGETSWPVLRAAAPLPAGLPPGARSPTAGSEASGSLMQSQEVVHTNAAVHKMSRRPLVRNASATILVGGGGASGRC